MSRYLVVGAGVVGTSIAAALAGLGKDVALVDASVPGEGAAAGCFAWANANNKHPIGYFDLSFRGLKKLAAEDTEGTFFHKSGSLRLSFDVETTRKQASRLVELAELGYEGRLLSPSEAARIEPGINYAGVDSVSYFPEEGWIDTRELIRSRLKLLSKAGGRLITNDPVQTILRSGKNVGGVVLASGMECSADVIILASGEATAGLARLAGSRISLVPSNSVKEENGRPHHPVTGLIAETTPLEPALRHVVFTPHLMLRPGVGNGVVLTDEGIGAAYSRDDPRFWSGAEELMERARGVLPASSSGHVAAARAGVRPLPVDGLPIVGWLTDTGGCYVAVTHSGTTLSLLLGELVALECCGETSSLLEPYRPERFDLLEVNHD